MEVLIKVALIQARYRYEVSTAYWTVCFNVRTKISSILFTRIAMPVSSTSVLLFSGEGGGGGDLKG